MGISIPLGIVSLFLGENIQTQIFGFSFSVGLFLLSLFNGTIFFLFLTERLHHALPLIDKLKAKEEEFQPPRLKDEVEKLYLQIRDRCDELFLISYVDLVRAATSLSLSVFDRIGKPGQKKDG